MDNTDIKKFVILELGKHHKPDDIIKEVCERTGMGWSDAQKFVRQVYAENRGEITGRQNGILMFLVVAEILGGFALSSGVLVATLSGWIIFLLRFPIPYLGNLVYFVIGIAMMLGGIRGFLNMKNPKK
jgi:hypothetical protein